MSSNQILLPQLAAWDLVVTSTGVNILVVPPGTVADRVIAADDGLVLEGESPVVLMGSARAAVYVRRQPKLLLVQAADRRSSEIVVPVLIHIGTIHARSLHDVPEPSRA